jgi:hypothetical protein
MAEEYSVTIIMTELIIILLLNIVRQLPIVCFMNSEVTPFGESRSAAQFTTNNIGRGTSNLREIFQITI